MPLYLARYRDGGEVKERLVEGGEKRNALGFMARRLIAVRKATQADIFRCAKAGIEIEVATGDEEIQEELEPEAQPEDEKPSPPATKATGGAAQEPEGK